MTILLLLCTAQISAYDENDLKRFKAINKCPGCDLSNADFSSDDLTGAELSGADLRNVNFSHTSTFMADFTGAILIGANFTGFQSKHADFTNADLTDSNMEEGNFRTAILCNTKTPWGIENIGCK